LVLAFWGGRIQAEHVGVNGVYQKLGKGKYKGSMVGCRWSFPAERTCFCSSGIFKTYDNLWKGESKEIPSQ
jgi:hypothetical protein